MVKHTISSICLITGLATACFSQNNKMPDKVKVGWVSNRKMGSKN